MSQAVTDLNTYCDVKDTRPINGLQMKRIRSKGQHNFCVMGFYSEGSALADLLSYMNCFVKKK